MLINEKQILKKNIKKWFDIYIAHHYSRTKYTWNISYLKCQTKHN